jgi:molecular chaperone DnaJ
MQVRLTGEGNAGANGGPAGNLYIQVEVEDHDVFEREEFDLIYPVTLNISEATLGVEKDIPTLDGPTSLLRIPNGTQPNTEFRIKGKGVPHIHSDRRGDLRVMVDVNIPKKLTDKQKALIQELSISFHDSSNINANIQDDDAPDTNDKGIFDRIKDVLG